MKNNDLEIRLNEQTGSKFGFRVKSAKLNKATSLCHVELFYNDGVILSAEDREKAEIIVKELLPSNFTYDIKFVKNFVVNETVADNIKTFLKKTFPSILYKIESVDCEEEGKKVVLSVNERLADYVAQRNVKKETEIFLEESFYSAIEVDIQFCQEQKEEIVEVEDYDLQIFDNTADRVIEVSEVEPIVGELTENVAYYIKDKTSPDEEVVFCGNLQFIKEYSYQPKKKPKENKEGELKEAESNQESASTEGEETVEQTEVKNERKYFKFAVEDFTGKMSCVFFANKNNYEQMLTLEAKQSVIVSGKLEADKFSGGVSLRVKAISKCKLPEKFEEVIIYKPEPKNYRYVFPEKYEQYSQADLFMVEDKPVNQFLLNHDIVVFDFETTGLGLDGSDKIIEIGAVKVEKGKITQKFMSFVDPEMKIPASSTAIHGITDEDVMGAPSYSQVLADFYKFTRGCYLSGYNIVGFDCIFLSTFGKKSGYNFDNPVIDVYKLAQQGVKGLKNYKLKTVADSLGVVLDNAHRAVYDTIATAEVLFKIAENMEISP